MIVKRPGDSKYPIEMGGNKSLKNIIFLLLTLIFFSELDYKYLNKYKELENYTGEVLNIREYAEISFD